MARSSKCFRKAHHRLATWVKECEAVTEVNMPTRDHLTPTERRLLEILVANSGQVVSNEELLEAMSSSNRRSNIGDLRTSIWRLRKKIEIDPALPRADCHS